MIVQLRDSGAEVVAPEDFTAFRVDVAPGVDAAHALRSSGAGRLDGDHAWIDTAWLVAAVGTRDEVWHASWGEMLDYADAHGWLSPEGLAIRAHLAALPG